MSRELEEMFLGGREEDEEEEEEVTAQLVLRELEDAWNNEKLAPELLPHRADFVEVMLEQVDQMEENLNALEGVDLRKDLHRLELSRIEYLLRSYLRARLEKIETHCLHLLRRTEEGRLSPAEAAYLREYSAASAHVLKRALDSMPAPVGMFNTEEMEVGPELEAHVCVKSKADVTESLVVKDSEGNRDEEVRLTEGSQHVLPYITIRDLLLANKVTLI